MILMKTKYLNNNICPKVCCPDELRGLFAMLGIQVPASLWVSNLTFFHQHNIYDGRLLHHTNTQLKSKLKEAKLITVFVSCISNIYLIVSYIE